MICDIIIDSTVIHLCVYLHDVLYHCVRRPYYIQRKVLECYSNESESQHLLLVFYATLQKMIFMLPHIHVQMRQLVQALTPSWAYSRLAQLLYQPVSTTLNSRFHVHSKQVANEKIVARVHIS